MTLDEFAEKHLDRRDELALRLLRGEPMADDERDELDRLNKTLELLLPKRERLPDDVVEAMRTVSRLTRTKI